MSAAAAVWRNIKKYRVSNVRNNLYDPGSSELLQPQPGAIVDFGEKYWQITAKQWFL